MDVNSQCRYWSFLIKRFNYTKFLNVKFTLQKVNNINRGNFTIIIMNREISFSRVVFPFALKETVPQIHLFIIFKAWRLSYRKGIPKRKSIDSLLSLSTKKTIWFQEIKRQFNEFNQLNIWTLFVTTIILFWLKEINEANTPLCWNPQYILLLT